MIESVEQKPIIEIRIRLTLDNDMGTYYLILHKNNQGQTLDRWLEGLDRCRIVNDSLFQYAIDQYNRDTEIQPTPNINQQ